MSSTVRRAEIGDIGRVKQLLQQVLKLHAAIRPDIFISGTTKYTDEELQKIFKNDETPVFVAVNEEQTVVGHLMTSV